MGLGKMNYEVKFFAGTCSSLLAARGDCVCATLQFVLHQPAAEI
jgi:hypothetical protein